MSMSNDYWERCRAAIREHYFIRHSLEEARLYERASHFYDLKVPAKSAGIILAEELSGMCQFLR